MIGDNYMIGIKNKLQNYTTLLFMISATLLGKVLGIVRDALLAYHYGIGTEATAFMAASSLPLNFFDFALGAAIGSAFIPVFSEIRKHKGEKEGLEFANEFVNLASLVALIVTIIGIYTAPFFIRLTAGGLTPETQILAVNLTRMMFPMLVFTAMAFTFVGILQTYGEFNVPAAISVLSNLVMIVYFVFFNSRFGVEGMAITVIIGWFLQMAIQIPFLHKKGYHYKPTLHFKGTYLKKVGILMLPILISTWVQPVNVLVNQRFASYISGGSAIVILTLANKVFIIIAGVFILAITNISFPSMSKFMARDDLEGFSDLVRQSLRMIIFFMVPLTVGVCIFSPLIIRVLYERGEFNATAETASALIFYTFGIVFYGLREVLNKAFFSAQDTKSPMRIGVIGITFNIVMSAVLVRAMGVNGLALAATLSALLMSILLLIQFNQKIHKVLTKEEIVYTLKALVGSGIMGLAVYLINNGMDRLGTQGLARTILSAGVAIVIGIAIYFAWARIVGMSIPHMKLDNKKVSNND